MSAVKELSKIVEKLTSGNEEANDWEMFLSCQPKKFVAKLLEDYKASKSEDEYCAIFPWNLEESISEEVGKTYTTVQVEDWMRLPFYVTAVWSSFYFDVEVDDEKRTLTIVNLKLPWPEGYEGPYRDDIYGESSNLVEILTESFFENSEEDSRYSVWNYVDFMLEEDPKEHCSFDLYRQELTSFLFAFGPAGLGKGWAGYCFDDKGRPFRTFKDLMDFVKSGKAFSYSFSDDYFESIMP